MMRAKFSFLFSLTMLAGVIHNVYAADADSISDMFTKGTVNGELKLYSYKLKTGSETSGSDTALGGVAYLKTASYNGVSLGMTFASANPVFNDRNDAGYNLLQDNGDGHHHDGYNKMLEYYVRGNWYDTTITWGAQEIFTPMMWHDYCEILPKTYRGLSVINRSVKDLELHAYYITDYSGWHDSDYSSLSAALSEDGPSKPMVILGARYNLPTENLGFKTNAEAWTYHMEDYMDMNYFRVKLSKQLGDVNVFFMPSYVSQKETGKKYADEHIDTYQYGFESGIKYKDFYTEFEWTKTGDTDFLGPWGFGRIIMQAYQTSFAANEIARGVKTGYDFSRVGIKGLSAMIWWAKYNRPLNLTVYPGANTEVDYFVKYEFTDQFNNALDGLSVSLAYQDVDWTNMNTGSQETRFRVNYKFSFGGK
ncbi:OprD family outer membrane porin [Shewanella yunxiaonensis]|uniref:OprD family outer membrane porin n=1 Tax=Shewanella yunxiaonensis TaxID=2829809 RepID=A0ABX7YWM4_9GAMM|nr:OprD family outer membrane porin [Shewanella yunxiaonensis]QUN07094.1 OprD family outer membrane porin [Shewanella yunxiaonensis]